MLSTALTSLLDVTHPILSAPMCGMAMGKLAGSVAAAGGVGLIGAGTSLMHTPEKIRSEWSVAQREIAAVSNKKGALGFGFLEGFMPENDGMFEACLQLNPDVIFLGGFVTDSEMHPKLIQAVRDRCSSTTKIIVQTFTVKEAVTAAKLGADAVVLQGSDAGGHGRQGDTGASVVSLIPQARKALQAAGMPNCVLIAAGGIATGRQMAASLLLGADGVHCGSAFVVTQESVAQNTFKQRILDTTDGTSGTVVSSVWDKLHKMGHPFVEGKFVGRALADSEALRRDFDSGITDADKDWYANADYSTRAVWTSTSSGLLNGPPISAGELVERMTEEAVAALKVPGHFEIKESR